MAQFLNIVKALFTALAIYILLNELRLAGIKRRVHAVNIKSSIISAAGRAIKKQKSQEISEKLRKAGNPLGLIPETFIISKVLLAIFVVLYTKIIGMETTQQIIFIVFAYFMPDLYIQFSQQDREEAFRREIPVIVDIFELGAAADIPLKDVFSMAAESAEHKQVKDEMYKLAAEYFMTNDKEMCLKKFAKNTGIVESEILAMSLLQGDKTGKTVHILSSLSSSLHNTLTARLVKQDKSTEYKVLAALFFLMASGIMLYIYPYFSNLEGGLKNIFM